MKYLRLNGEALLVINEKLVFEMNQKGLRPIKLQLGSRSHKLHLFGQINTFDISKMSNKHLRSTKVSLGSK